MLTNVSSARLQDEFLSTLLISGSANGCFSLLKEDKTALLYSAEGKLLKKCSDVLDAIVLNDGSYFVKHFPRKGSVLARSFLCYTPVWSLYSQDDALLLAEMSACEVYANGWYCVEKEERKQLFDANHTLMAEGFSQCKVFKLGYALRNNEAYYKYGDWKLFFADGDFVRTACNVEAILGDGLILVRHSPNEPALLYSFDGEELVERNVSSFQAFANGRFALKTVQKDGNVVGKMYTSDGSRMTVTVSNATFLPDGRSIGFHDKLISGIYRPNGLIISDEVWKFEIAAGYYVISYEDEDALFNDKSENLGSGYVLIASEGVFALFENEQAYHLFNQNGEVLTLPIEQ